MSASKSILLLIVMLGVVLSTSAQDITGSLEQHIDSIIDNLPGNSGDDYVEPTSIQRANWSGLVSSILQGDYSMTDSMNYHLIEYLDVNTGSVFYILEEKSPEQYYWGTYIFNPSPCRTKLVIQSPHPKYDFNTGKEGIFCFQRLGALAFCLSGTHRCNNNQASSCSGSTSSCGASAAFRVSDMPHSTNGMFHATSTAIVSEVQDAVFIQLHGFSKQTTDPYVILSNGTRETPSSDYIPLITSGLLQADSTLTFKVAHLDISWTRLIGFTNVQGRLINNSADHCNSSATTTTGNFVHMEQEKTKLRDDSTGWHKVYQALAFSFPCDSTTPVSTEDLMYRNIHVYPNPFIDELIIEGEGIEAVILYNQLGEKVLEIAGARNLDLSAFSSGLYFLGVKRKDQTIFRKLIKL